MNIFAAVTKLGELENKELLIVSFGNKKVVSQ